MAYTLGNKCAKNLCKWTVLVQLIIENVVTCFYWNTVYIYTVAVANVVVSVECRAADTVVGQPCQSGWGGRHGEKLCISQRWVWVSSVMKVDLFWEEMHHQSSACFFFVFISLTCKHTSCVVTFVCIAGFVAECDYMRCLTVECDVMWCDVWDWFQ